MMKKENRCLIILHISTFILAFNALFAKLIHLSPASIIGFRALIALLFLVVYMKWRKRKIFILSKSDLPKVILSGVLVSLHFVSFFYAVQISTVAIAMLSLSTVPVLTSLLESMELKRMPSRWDVIASLLILLGIYFIVPEFEIQNESFQGILWGLFSSFTFSLRNVMSKGFVRKYSGEDIMLFQFLVMAILLSPFAWKSISVVSSSDLMYLVIMGVFTTAIAHTMLLKGLEGVEAKTASISWNLQPIYSIIYAMILLSEIPQASVVVGGALIVSAVVGETICMKRKKIAISIE